MYLCIFVTTEKTEHAIISTGYTLRVMDLIINMVSYIEWVVPHWSVLPMQEPWVLFLGR